MVVDLDAESSIPRIAGTREQFQRGEIQDRVLDFLRGRDEASEKEIQFGVTGKKDLIVRALRDLVEQGRVSRSGRGVRKNPFVYRIADSGSRVLVGKPGTGEPETVSGGTNTSPSGSPDLPSSGGLEVGGNHEDESPSEPAGGDAEAPSAEPDEEVLGP
jgi:hypothetical protein